MRTTNRSGYSLWILVALIATANLSAQVSTKNQQKKPDVRTTQCDGCEPPPFSIRVTLSCSRDRRAAEASPKHVTAELGNPLLKYVAWVPRESSLAHWKVQFEGKDPCGRREFTPSSSYCEFKGPVGKYRYRIEVEGCAAQGRGVLEVK